MDVCKADFLKTVMRRLKREKEREREENLDGSHSNSYDVKIIHERTFSVLKSSSQSVHEVQFMKFKRCGEGKTV